MLTEQDASEAMRYFLTAFWKRGGSDPESELVDLLSWTDTGMWKDGGTNDQAQWDDWLAAVRAVQSGRTRRALLGRTE